MTREEAKQVFLSRGYVEVEGGTIYDPDKWRESCHVISEWLEQEPCDDCISRQAVLDIVNNPLNIRLDEIIKKLPSVTQKSETVTEFADRCRECGKQYVKRQTGHWIEEIDDYGEVMGWHCDKCYEDSGFTTTCKWDFCPSCGARMVEPQESEVSNEWMNRNLS